jgi:hypothetical protein
MSWGWRNSVVIGLDVDFDVDLVACFVNGLGKSLRIKLVCRAMAIAYQLHVIPVKVKIGWG